MSLKNQILEILEKNAKLSNAEIAVMLGENEEKIAETVKELEAQKIILGYKTVVNWDKIEKEKITAYIELSITPEEGHGFEKIAKNIIKEFPQVKSISLMSGGFDFLIEIDGESMKDVALFVAEKISPIDCVVSTKTHFVLRRYKHEGIELTEKTKDERRVISL